VGRPNTSAGSRLLDVPADVLPALQVHLDRLAGPGPQACLFASESGGPMVLTTLSRLWQSARREIGRPDLFLHDLRHSGLRWAAASGASVVELMRRVGYANPGAALRYQPATEDRGRTIADALSGLASVHALPADSPPGARRTDVAQWRRY
jgi:integrase